jgi:hypothetical protein
MKLVVIDRAAHQTLGIYENVCMAVRWRPIGQADLASYRRALAAVHRRSPAGFAFLQVNRFDPAQTTSVDSTVALAFFTLLNERPEALRILVLTMPNAPLVAAGLRGQWARMALTTKLRPNYHIFEQLTEATLAISEALRTPGVPPLPPVELEAAVEALANERLAAG